MAKPRTTAVNAVLWLFLSHLAVVTAPSPALAAEDTDTARSEEPAFVPETETRHTLSVEGTPMEYVARAGTLTVPGADDDGEQGRMFYVAYSAAAGDVTARPLTFVVNGGPGAAAAYLHMGAMGPKRVDFADDGRVPAGGTPPVDNLETWLAFSDLVFVDPIGTGYSRAIAGDGESEGDGSAFWETSKDLDALGAFVRLYLTRHERWLSPVVMAGESYGGFRVAAMADRLQSSFGISVRGLVMISPALELDLLSGDRFRLMPWISRVPSFAAAARHHGRARTGDGPVPLGDDSTPEIVERFVMEEMLPGMARGNTLGDARRSELFSRLARHTGLSADLVTRYGAKLPPEVFAARLLEDDGRIVSLYDASISYRAPHPAGERYRDPRLARISAAVVAAFNHDVRTRLGVKTDLPYEVLNRRVNARWQWRERSSRRGPPGAADDLEEAFKSVEGLRALLVHGRYDLVTPYFGSTYLVSQLDLPPELRRRLTVRTYEGGHMFYSRAGSRKAFFEDARTLYAEIAGDGP